MLLRHLGGNQGVEVLMSTHGMGSALTSLRSIATKLAGIRPTSPSLRRPRYHAGYCRRSHDDVIKWKHFPRYWPFVQGIHRSPVNSPHKGQWRGASMFSLICVWTNSWANNEDAGDLRRHRAHYDVIVIFFFWHIVGYFLSTLILWKAKPYFINSQNYFANALDWYQQFNKTYTTLMFRNPVKGRELYKPILNKQQTLFYCIFVTMLVALAYSVLYLCLK